MRVDHLVKIGLQMTFRLSRFHEPVGFRFDSEALGDPCSSLAIFGRFVNSGDANPPGNCEAIFDLSISSGVALGLGFDFGAVISPLADSETAADGCKGILLSEEGRSCVLHNSDSRIFDGEEYRLETGTPRMMKLSNSIWSRTVPRSQGGARWGSYSDSEADDNLSMGVETAEISKAWPMVTSEPGLTATDSGELTVVVARGMDDSSCATTLIMLVCVRSNVINVPAPVLSAGRIGCLGPGTDKAFS